MTVKKFLVFFLINLFLLFSESVFSNSSFMQEKVIIYNWSDYIPEGVLAGFTKETGIKVEYYTYDSNEEMYSRVELLKGRGYDILVPSTYMIGKMKKEGLIQRINRGRLSNFSNLDESLLNKPYDPDNKYSIPYMWGSTGIALNRAKYKKIAITKWSDLLDFRWQNKLVMVDDMRDAFSIGLKANGFSINTRNEDEIDLAYQYLESLSKNIRLYSENPREAFLLEDVVKGEDGVDEEAEDNDQKDGVDIGIMWNGDAVVAKDKIASMEYIYPEEGVSFWADSFVITSHAKNIHNAHKFIDYMLRPEVAALCATELGYATPNSKAKDLLPKEIRTNKSIFPPLDVVNKSEFQEDVGDANNIYNIYWNKLKEIRLVLESLN